MISWKSITRLELDNFINGSEISEKIIKKICDIFNALPSPTCISEFLVARAFSALKGFAFHDYIKTPSGNDSELRRNVQVTISNVLSRCIESDHPESPGFLGILIGETFTFGFSLLNSLLEKHAKRMIDSILALLKSKRLRRPKRKDHYLSVYLPNVYNAMVILSCQISCHLFRTNPDSPYFSKNRGYLFKLQQILQLIQKPRIISPKTNQSGASTPSLEDIPTRDDYSFLHDYSTQGNGVSTIFPSNSFPHTSLSVIFILFTLSFTQRPHFRTYLSQMIALTSFSHISSIPIIIANELIMAKNKTRLWHDHKTKHCRNSSHHLPERDSQKKYQEDYQDTTDCVTISEEERTISTKDPVFSDSTSMMENSYMDSTDMISDSSPLIDLNYPLFSSLQNCMLGKSMNFLYYSEAELGSIYDRSLSFPIMSHPHHLCRDLSSDYNRTTDSMFYLSHSSLTTFLLLSIIIDPRPSHSLGILSLRPSLLDPLRQSYPQTSFTSPILASSSGENSPLQVRNFLFNEICLHSSGSIKSSRFSPSISIVSSSSGETSMFYSQFLMPSVDSSISSISRSPPSRLGSILPLPASSCPILSASPLLSLASTLAFCLCVEDAFKDWIGEFPWNVVSIPEVISSQCKGITKAGNRCLQHTLLDNGFCCLHQNQTDDKICTGMTKSSVDDYKMKIKAGKLSVDLPAYSVKAPSNNNNINSEKFADDRTHDKSSGLDIIHSSSSSSGESDHILYFSERSPEFATPLVHKVSSPSTRESSLFSPFSPSDDEETEVHTSVNDEESGSHSYSMDLDGNSFPSIGETSPRSHTRFQTISSEGVYIICEVINKLNRLLGMTLRRRNGNLNQSSSVADGRRIQMIGSFSRFSDIGVNATDIDEDDNSSISGSSTGPGHTTFKHDQQPSQNPGDSGERGKIPHFLSSVHAEDNSLASSISAILWICSTILARVRIMALDFEDAFGPRKSIDILSQSANPEQQHPPRMHKRGLSDGGGRNGPMSDVFLDMDDMKKERRASFVHGRLVQTSHLAAELQHESAQSDSYVTLIRHITRSLHTLYSSSLSLFSSLHDQCALSLAICICVQIWEGNERIKYMLRSVKEIMLESNRLFIQYVDSAKSARRRHISQPRPQEFFSPGLATFNQSVIPSIFPKCLSFLCVHSIYLFDQCSIACSSPSSMFLSEVFLSSVHLLVNALKMSPSVVPPLFPFLSPISVSLSLLPVLSKKEIDGLYKLWGCLSIIGATDRSDNSIGRFESYNLGSGQLSHYSLRSMHYLSARRNFDMPLYGTLNEEGIDNSNGIIMMEHWLHQIAICTPPRVWGRKGVGRR
ncbi:hypothetical protein ADUPG1_006742, partial [Aduncisulcus paluster]